MKINYIDIGAIGGLPYPWVKFEDKINWKLSFEPNEELVIEEKDIKYNYCIWDSEGESPFYLYGPPPHHGASLLKPNIEWVDENFNEIKNQGKSSLNRTWKQRSTVTSEKRIAHKSLDNVLFDLESTLNGEKFDFLKSDTQSGEYFVLKGAEKFLRTNCLGVQLELYRYPLYKGMKLENEVVDFMGEIGFKPIARTCYNRSFQSQSDYVFIREPRSEEEEEKIRFIKEVYGVSGNGIEEISLYAPFLYRFKTKYLNKVLNK